MMRLKERYQKSKHAFVLMTEGNNLLLYDVAMGMISSFLVAILDTFAFFLVSRDTIKTPFVFLAFAVIMALQFIGFYAIYRHKFQMKSKTVRIVMEAHPFLIISLGIAVTYIYQGFSNQLYAFLVAVFVTALIQIYSLRRRIFIYVYAFIVFNGMMFLVNGGNSLFVEGLRISFIVTSVGFIYSMIQYRTNSSRKHLFDLLEEKNTAQEDALLKLKKAYFDLDQNHRVTEMMLSMTSSMLNTDFFDDVLQMILEGAIKAIPKADCGSILIYNGEEMEYKAACGYELKELQKVKLKFANSFQAFLDDIYEPAIIVNLESFDEEHVDTDTLSLLRDQSALLAKSVMTCSFKFENVFFGSINLDNFESETAFDESDKRLIKQLAKQIEIIITIHKLYGKAISRNRYDTLTKACSRSYHQELLTEALASAKEHNYHLSICYLDINYFKLMNDECGHEAGDEYLRYFAEAIRDNAGGDFFLSRLGGDEFALVYPTYNSIEAENRISNIRQYLNTNPFKYKEVEKTLAFGCGVVTYPGDGDKIDNLMSLADNRMYKNKAIIKSQQLHNK